MLTATNQHFKVIQPLNAPFKNENSPFFSVAVLMLFPSFVNSQQKVREEQEGYPDHPKQHLRGRRTVQLCERG